MGFEQSHCLICKLDLGAPAACENGQVVTCEDRPLQFDQRPREGRDYAARRICSRSARGVIKIAG